MKKYALLIVLLSIMIVTLGCPSSYIFKDVTVEQAGAMMADKHDLVVLDVRTPEEYHQGAIPDSINIDYKAADFNIEISKLDKETAYLIYCRSGKRSAEAAALMNNTGFKEVYNLLEGYLGWESMK